MLAHPVEFWTGPAFCPVDIERQARETESAGWDGMFIYDSQNIGGDCYAGLALAARATSTLKLSTGVTNPVTRHPATTASAAATIQHLSEGRFVLGIARGDSALAHVGFSPAPLGVFRRYISVVRRLLGREQVPFEELNEYGRSAQLKPVDALHLANNVDGSLLQWWTDLSQAPPPVDVACTGPRVIGLAATEGDSVCLAVGADAERIRWGVELARAAHADAGHEHQLRVGAYVPIACHEEEAAALELVRGVLAANARFAVLHGRTTGPIDDSQRRSLNRLSGRYDMTEHSKSRSAPGDVIDLEFARHYAIIGPPEVCVERLLGLIEAGISRVIMIRPEPTTPMHLGSAAARRSQSRLAVEVLPAVRSELSR